MDSAVLLAVVVKPTRSEQLVSASDPDPDPSHDGHYLLEQTNVFFASDTRRNDPHSSYHLIGLFPARKSSLDTSAIG